MLDKIAKLLALAEAAGTSEEAEAAFAKAQSLASRYAIDLEVARRAAAPKAREVPTTRTVTIGEKGKRANKPLILLYSRIADANDVELLIASNSTMVYATGMPSDLDHVEAMWSGLATTMVRLGDQLIRDKNAPWRSETARVFNERTWEYEEKPVSGQGARRSFYDGFIGRIGERLRDARLEAVKEADHFHNDGEQAAAGDESGAVHGMALVLKEKRAEVEEAQWAWYERNYGKRRRPRGGWSGRSSGTHSGTARAAGHAAANRASLSGRKAVGA
jgi:hypothetical protein